MAADSGKNAQNVKLDNRRLVLKTIAANPLISRSELAEATNLSKMTMSNIIAELIQSGLVSEQNSGRMDNASVGRRPVYLDIAADSPCVCGIFVGRAHAMISMADLRARIFLSQTIEYPDEIDQQSFLRLLIDGFRALEKRCTRRILGIGIAAMGPVSSTSGMILTPANFHGMRDIPIVAAFTAHTRYPCFLMPDNLAGALAEKLYGRGRGIANFMFLLLWDGIGCGIIVDDKPYGGHQGMSGEIGHTTIKYDGARCPCGQRGCLELYASIPALRGRVRAAIDAGAATCLAGRELSWPSILDAAYANDAVALDALGEYCDYVAVALVNYINLYDPHTIFLCHQGSGRAGDLLVELVRERVRGRFIAPGQRAVAIENATFADQAVIMGSIAICTSRVFSGELPFANEH